MKRHRQSRQSWSKMALDSELRRFGRWRSEGNKDSWVCKALHPGVYFWWVNWLPVADSNSAGSCQNQCLFSLLREMFLVGRLSREATVTNDWAAVRARTLALGSWGSGPTSAMARCTVSGVPPELFISIQCCYWKDTCTAIVKPLVQHLAYGTQ